jgi:hypothetical protein
MHLHYRNLSLEGWVYVMLYPVGMTTRLGPFTGDRHVQDAEARRPFA